MCGVKGYLDPWQYQDDPWQYQDGYDVVQSGSASWHGLAGLLCTAKMKDSNRLLEKGEVTFWF